MWSKQCVGDHFEHAPIANTRYYAFTDPSVAAPTRSPGHLRTKTQRFVIDAIREVRPPFSPAR